MSTSSNEWVDKKYPSQLLQTGQHKGLSWCIEGVTFYFSLADAVIRGPDDMLYFAEPFVKQMTMAEFLSRLSASSVPQN